MKNVLQADKMQRAWREYSNHNLADAVLRAKVPPLTRLDTLTPLYPGPSTPFLCHPRRGAAFGPPGNASSNAVSTHIQAR